MGTPIRVLIVEDSEDDTLLLVRELKRGGFDPIFERVDTPEAMAAALERQTWDIVIADYVMPHFSGLNALKLLQKSGRDIPFIIVSGSIGEDTAVAAMKAGANDYLMKNKLARLVPAIEQELRQVGVRRKFAESEKRYREVVENATEIIYTVDEKGNFTYANPTGLKVTGYSLQELRELNYADLVAPDYRERVMDIYSNQFRQRIPTTYVEFPFFNKAGKIIWFGQNTSLVIGDGKVAGFHIIARDITERKRAEEALRESEERYRTLVETSPDPITLLDLNLNIDMANRPALALYGYESPEEVVGQSALNFIALEDRPRAVEDVRKMLETGSIETLEYTLLRKGGVPFSAELRTSLILNVEKKPLAFICVSRDITERKQMEEALRDSQTELSAIIENAPIVMLLVDRERQVRKANGAAIKFAGHPAEEMIGLRSGEALHCLHSLDDPRGCGFGQFCETCTVRNAVIDTLETGKSHYEVEAKLPFDLKGKPEEKYLLLSTIPLTIREEQLVLVCIEDITERKRGEEALRESEETERALLNATTDSVLLIDTAGTILALNEMTAKKLGKTVNEMLGYYLYDFLPPEVVERRKAYLDKVIRTGDPAYFEDERQGIWFDNCVYPILDAKGNVTKLSIHARDITERKHAEEERVVLVDQLRQSQKMEAIGRLAGGVAHDFNNLLTVIKGYCQLSLVEMKEGNPLREAFEVINKATEKAADLIRQLLAFSRRQIMEMRVLDLNSLLQNLDKMLRRIIGEDIELVILLEKELGTVKTDPGQIEQVVMNLAVNAKDAMPKGGKLIIETANVELDEAYAHAHVAVTPGRYVMIAVSDTGTGMAPGVRDRVFEPFFTTKEKGKGTGLGLSTVYGIVKQSSGNIWVYSEPGKGTTLKIYLPRVDEPAEELKEKVVGEEFPRGSETILIVEDDEAVRNLAVRILRGQGFTVLDGSYGDEALNVCGKHKGPIHLLLTDVVMPGMNGRALSERLSHLHPEMKVLYMSGYTDDAIVHHGVMEKGMNYIQKPFTVNGLTRKVREVLKQSRQH